MSLDTKKVREYCEKATQPPMLTCHLPKRWMAPGDQAVAIKSQDRRKEY